MTGTVTLPHVGAALGIAVLLTAAAQTEALTQGGTGTVVALAAGFRYSFAAGAAITIVGALIIFLVMRRSPSGAGDGEGKAIRA